MLEVVGSDVLVDGGGGGDGGGADRNVEDGAGRDVVVTEGLDMEIDSFNWVGVGVSGGQVSDYNMETSAEGFEEPVGSPCEQIHVVSVEEVYSRENEEGSLERPLLGGGEDATEAGVLCSKGQYSGTETGLGVSLANSGSSCEQAPVVAEDNIAVFVGEEIFEGESAGEGVGSDVGVTKVLESEIDFINGVGVGALKCQVLDSNMESRSEGFEEPVGSLGELIHVLVEDVSMRANVEGGLERPLIDAGRDATEASVLSSKDQNSGTETGLGISLQNSGSSCVQTPLVVVDKVVVCVGEEIFKGDSVDEGVGSDVVVTEVMGREIEFINMGTRAVGFEEPVSSLSEQIHAVSVEEVSMRANEEGGLERALVGGFGDATEVSVLCSKDQNSGNGTGLGVSLATVCTESQFSHDQTEVNDNEVSAMESISEEEIPVSDDAIRTVACSEDDKDTKCESTCAIAESSNDQAFVAGTEAITVMDFKEVSNLEGEVASEVLNGYTCIENNEELNILTVGGSMGKEGIAQGNTEASGEKTQVDNKKEYSILDCQGIVQVPASCPLDENITFSKIDEELKVETLGKNTVEVPTVGIDSPQTMDHGTSCPLDENLSLSEKDGLKVETLEKKTVEVPTMGHDSPQIGDHSTSIITYTNSLEGNASLQDNKKETESQPAYIPTRVEDRDQTMNMVITDEKSVHLMGADTQEVRGSMGFGLSECFDLSATGNLYLDNCSVGEDMEVKEQCNDAEKLNQNGGQKVDMGDYPYVEDKSLKQTTLRCGNLAKVHQPNYLLVPENEAEFSLSDIVWGKVRSHLWWPGQIFDSADASEEAMKYLKKDCFLVAYFRDGTFAWNEPSLLKPFWSKFSQIEKLSNSEAFQSAVSCALEEVSRRVQLALACSCLPREIYDKIKFQDFENTGIREESCRLYGVDKSTGVSCFEPHNLLHYIKALAQFPSSRANRVQLVVAKAQLLTFNRLKGYYWLPKIQFCEGFLEKNVDNPPLCEAFNNSLNDEQIVSFKGRVKNETGSSHKRKHNLKDIGYPRKKERMSELMGNMENSLDGEDGSDLKGLSKLVSSFSGKKRKSGDFLSDGSDVQDRRISIYAANLCTAASPIPKPSFKTGECIRRTSSQLTGSPSNVKCNSEKFQKVDNGSGELPDNSKRRTSFSMECSSLDEMLSQLLLTALDPLNGYRLSTTVISFLSSFRKSISLGRYKGKNNLSVERVGGSRKKKTSRGTGQSEEYEFDDVNDSYWTDMSIQNNSEEQPSGDSKNREGEYQLAAFDLNKPPKSSRKTYCRKKRFSNGTHEMDIEGRNTFIDKVKQDMSPAELLLNFSEGDPIPSVINLGKIFRRFGHLKDSETEVDVETSRARVVFKRGADAQVALSSAETFNIFGPATVKYQLNYTPSRLNSILSISFKTLPLASTKVLGEAS